MPIIFGWGYTRRKAFGPVSELECNNCGHKRDWILMEVSTWFTLFFIPVIPYDRKRFFFCPICSNAIDLEKQDSDRMKLVAKARRDLEKGKASEEELKKSN